MARDDSDPSRDPERPRKASGVGARNGTPDEQRERAERDRAERAAGWTPRRGRSGYGLESIRPHLRAQLEQQRLLRPTFPPDSDEPQK